jgi:ubiquinone biosynthesis protein COQ9
MKRKKMRQREPRGRESAQDKIFQAVLKEVSFDGWSEKAYARGLAAVSIGRGEADLVLPSGIRDLIDLFNKEADQAMQEAIESEPGFRNFRVRDKVAFAVRSHLTHLTPRREAMRRLLYWYALPLNAPLGLKRLGKTVDLIWRAAGDQATDFNFYTKRILLAGVLKATILFWLDDETRDCEASWAFLDRRLGEVLKIGKTISLLKEWKPAEMMDMVRERLRRA